jgi:hypothetical protein
VDIFQFVAVLAIKTLGFIVPVMFWERTTHKILGRSLEGLVHSKLFLALLEPQHATSSQA